MNHFEDRAGQLLRETFADAERLIPDEQGFTAVRPTSTARRTPILLAAAAVLAIIAGALYAAGPDTAGPRPAGTPTATTPATSAADNDTVQIYAAVIAGASGLDRPSAGWPKVFVLDAPYEGEGRVGAPAPRRGQPFDPALRAGIERIVGKIAPVEWVASQADATRNQNGCVSTKDGGTLITMSPIKRVGSHVEVGIRAYQSCLGAHWLTYRLDTDGRGGWRITGTVGEQAIS